MSRKIESLELIIPKSIYNRFIFAKKQGIRLDVDYILNDIKYHARNFKIDDKNDCLVIREIDNYVSSWNIKI